MPSMGDIPPGRIMLKNTIKNCLKTILPYSWQQKVKKIINVHDITPPLIQNYYSTRKNKKVLISYITAPFTKNKNFYHTNQQEALLIGDIFDDLGYIVDICEYNTNYDIDYEKYDCIFGFGYALANYFYQRQNRAITIYYGTGNHICERNFLTLERAKSVFAEHGIWLLDSCRILQEAWSEGTTLVDGMIILGNQQSLNAYRKFYKGPILAQPATFNAAIPAKSLVRDYPQAQKNFFWFAGRGAIHKGLDLLLEVFAKRKDIHLHIGADLERERSFLERFSRELSSANIHYHGKLDIRSDTFLKIVCNCAFAILPSCSEGQATSMLNLMCNGLIPVMTDKCGIDYRAYGIQIKDCSTRSVLTAIDFCLNMSVDDILRRSKICMVETRERHNINTFQKSMLSNIKTLLKKHA